MKIKKILSWLFGVVGTVLLVVAVIACFVIQGRADRVSGVPKEAAAQAQALMDALTSGDLSQTEGLLGFSLGLENAPDDLLGSMVWQAYTGSFSYEWKSTCTTASDGVRQDVLIRCLDIPLTMDHIVEQAQKRVENSRETPEQALLAVAPAVLAEPGNRMETQVTLLLRQQDGQWSLVPDNALKKAICGRLPG